MLLRSVLMLISRPSTALGYPFRCVASRDDRGIVIRRSSIAELLESRKLVQVLNVETLGRP
jgi:hypothetical protein